MGAVKSFDFTEALPLLRSHADQWSSAALEESSGWNRNDKEVNTPSLLSWSQENK